MKKAVDLNKLCIAFTQRELCNRCGTCIGLCPQTAIAVDEDFYPVFDNEKCIECGICKRGCPGGQLSFKELAELTFGDVKISADFDGHVLNTFIGYSTDTAFAHGGAGGGVVTAILWDMLKNMEVDGCVVSQMNPEKPWRGKAFIAKSYDDLLKSQGSKYTIIPGNSIIREVKDVPGKFAFVALPCQVHGLRMAMKLDADLKQKVALIVGLFCGGSLEPYVVPELLQMRGIKKDEVGVFEFRGGDWPGKMRAILKNGRIVNMHCSNYKDGAYNYLAHLCMPKGCQTCIDGSSEFADISVSDVWTRDQAGKYETQGQSRVLVRTQRGIDTLTRSVERNALFLKNVTGDERYQTHAIQTKRKRRIAPARIARLLKSGKEAPRYDRSFGRLTMKECITERFISFLLGIGERRFIRYPLIKFLTSPQSIFLIKIRQLVKKRRYRNAR